MAPAPLEDGPQAVRAVSRLMNSFDRSDGDHVPLLAGCTGEVDWGWGIVGVRRVHHGDPDFDMPTVVGEGG